MTYKLFFQLYSHFKFSTIVNIIYGSGNLYNRTIDDFLVTIIYSKYKIFIDDIVYLRRFMDFFLGQQAGQPAVSGQGAPVDTIRRHEVDIVLANQRELTSSSRELK